MIEFDKKSEKIGDLMFFFTLSSSANNVNGLNEEAIGFWIYSKRVQFKDISTRIDGNCIELLHSF